MNIAMNIKRIMDLSNERKEIIDKIQTALDDYHYALDTRQHGDIAVNTFTHAVAEILDSPWERGKVAKARGEEV